VSLTFDEPVTLLPASLRVYAPDGSRIDRGDVAHPGGRGQEVRVSLRASDARGSYLVSWRVVSDDSHPVSGAFTFAVGHPSTAPPRPDEAAPTSVRFGLALGRWLGYAGAALLVGVLVAACWWWQRGWHRRRVRRLAVAGGILLVVGAVVDLLLKGPSDAALGWGSITDRTLLREVLGSTYGRATLARVALAVVALGALRLRRPTRLTASLAALGVGITFALAGHAAAGGGRVTATINDVAHVTAASVWLGGLVLVLVAIEEPAAVRRFSPVALGSVLVLAATGVYQAARQVGSWAALRHTTYGKELLAKLAVIAVVIAVAALVRALVWRRDVAGPARIRPLVLGETAGLCVVLGITSALVATEPAKTAYHPSVGADLRLVGDLVQVSAVPAGDRQMRVHVYVFGRDGKPADPKQLTTAVSLPSRQVGPLPVRLAVAGPGHRQGIVAVPMTGSWRLAVTVRTSAIDEATGYVTLPIG
jgi:copper transport protein